MAFNIEEGRYIILGSIDGLLATLGIIVGVSITEAQSSIVISAAFGGAIALAMTNGLGSYLAESTVMYGKLAETEKSLLRDLSDTYIESQTRKKIIKDSITHGGASFLGSLVPLAPYILSAGSLVVSIVLSLGSLVVLGIYSGFVSKTSYIVSVIKMVGLGALIIVTIQLLRLSHLTG
ncbi:MAG: VIT1/CCC1 transporter family protein [Euryarchaeota archaeon]|nr:VIT1/CCC1 transporter family protein [Euryarchaeota archaeon]